MSKDAQLRIAEEEMNDKEEEENLLAF